MNLDEIKAAQKKASVELLTDFFKLADEWSLTIEEQKTLIGDGAIDSILKTIAKHNFPLLSEGAIAKIVMLLGIRSDIHILYPEPECHTYIRSPNKYFDGHCPLEVMLNESIDGMSRVQAYLKATILGGYC